MTTNKNIVSIYLDRNTELLQLGCEIDLIITKYYLKSGTKKFYKEFPLLGKLRYELRDVYLK